MSEEQDTKKLKRENFETIMTAADIDDLLNTEAKLLIKGADGMPEILTCYGDICKIVDMAMDYARLLENLCDEWKLTGFHRAKFELHAEKMRKIAKKYGEAIGYDYGMAWEKCLKKKSKKDDGVGEEALTLGYQKAQREAEAKTREALEKLNNKNQK